MPDGSPATLRFGLFIGQANRSLGEVIDLFQMAEGLGFDHAWLADHLVAPGENPDAPCLEAWTTLAAVAARTKRIRLGVLVSSNTFRHPALLLKMAISVDHISNVRVILGIGTGWEPGEHRRYGIHLPEASERVERLGEALEVITLLMGDRRVDYQGRYYQLEDAPLQPRPIQARIPLLVAAHRPRTIRLAARYADQWDTYPTYSGSATEGVGTQVEERLRTLEFECRAIGRDPATVRRSTWIGGQGLDSSAAYLDFALRSIRAGFTDLSTGLPTVDNLPVLRQVAEQHIPVLRAGNLPD